ncbi:MAG TPA: hypothetical protein VFD69_21490 [Vicinamibacterales bacterium]|nr:hypothetical protein [Vicinamibacterales bacterium]
MNGRVQLAAIVMGAFAAAAVSLSAQQPAAQPPAAPAAAPALQTNCDVSGEWGARSREDTEDRVLLGTNLGDYTGFALNDAGRQFARHWSASLLSLPTQQAIPHPAMYIMRGPGPNVRIAKFVDPTSRQFIGYTLDGVYGRNDRTIWMDGRPHPPDYAEYTWDGFSTGRCERGMLVVTTTHMKYGYHRRNGVPSSVKSKMTEYFIRHGTELTIMQFTEDPVYLEETLARTTDFQINPGQNVGAPGFGFEIVDEVATWPKGYVPAWPFGTEHREFAETLGVPYESTQGYKEASYPEYLPKLRKLMAEMPAKPAAK